ncbi:MAG: TlpA disulfide reductase family protein [Candidatus Edwardsbacteria bacterium]
MKIFSFFLGIFLTIPAYAQDSLKMGDRAPTFYLKTLHNNDFYLSDYCGKPRNKKSKQERNVVILSFWATWCKPCQEEIPFLEEIQGKFGLDSLRIFLVASGEEKQTIEDSVFTRVISLPVLFDKYSRVKRLYQVENLPTLFIIDREGTIRWIKTGFSEQKKEEMLKNVGRSLGIPETTDIESRQ